MKCDFMDMTLPELIKKVQEQFDNGQPNGWELEWKHDRFLNDIESIVSPFPVLNCTSFDCSFCNSYEILFDFQNRNYHRILILKFSFIVPVYCAYWTRRKGNSNHSETQVSETDFEAPSFEKKVCDSIEGLNFFKLPDEWHHAKVPKVKLELSDSKNVTLDKCLFLDHF